MKPEHAKLIEEAANMIGLDVEVHDDYSGRGMYGETTAALVGDMGDIMACVAQAMRDLVEDRDNCSDDAKLEAMVDPDQFIDDLMKIRTDSMGRSVVYY